MGVVSAGGGGLVQMPAMLMEEFTTIEFWLTVVLKVAITHMCTEIISVLQLHRQPNHQHCHRVQGAQHPFL